MISFPGFQQGQNCCEKASGIDHQTQWLVSSSILTNQKGIVSSKIYKICLQFAKNGLTLHFEWVG